MGASPARSGWPPSRSSNGASSRRSSRRPRSNSGSTWVRSSWSARSIRRNRSQPRFNGSAAPGTAWAGRPRGASLRSRSMTCAVSNFATLEREALRAMLQQMATTLPERIQGANPKIFYDRAAGRIRPRRSARLSAITSGGTIPEAGNYDVVIASAGRKVGDVEEDFAQESMRGDVFSLGSMPWQILGISKNRLMVEPAPGMAPSLPFWQTEAGGRSPALSTEVSELRRAIAERLIPAEADSAAAPLTVERDATPSAAERAAADWLIDECRLEPAAATQAVAYVRRCLAALGAIPGERTLIVERFFDGLGGTQIVIH